MRTYTITRDEDYEGEYEDIRRAEAKHSLANFIQAAAIVIIGVPMALIVMNWLAWLFSFLF